MRREAILIGTIAFYVCMFSGINLWVCHARTCDNFLATNVGARLMSPDDLKRLNSSAPSRFGKLTSRRWAYGATYIRENLKPVQNPNPAPEPQPIRDHPFDVEINGDGSKVYVALQGTELLPGSEVAVYEVATNHVIKRISLKRIRESVAPGLSPYRLTIHPDGRFLFVTNRFSNFISVIDTDIDEVVAEIPTDYYCQGMTFVKDGSIAYTVNRYLGQVFIIDISTAEGNFEASMRELGGLDDMAYFGNGDKEGIHNVLLRGCGAVNCHARNQGGFVAGVDPVESFLSVISHVIPGDAANSRLLQSVVRTRHGGYADLIPKFHGHTGGTAIYHDPLHDRDYRAIAEWIDNASEGPGIPVGNPRSKPKVCVMNSNGRYLFVGNTGTQDISIVDTQRGREVGAIYIQNVVNDLIIYHSPETGHDYLIVTTEGIGFGVGSERDPYAGETWDRTNLAAQFSVWRDLKTGRALPKDQQTVLGPFDAVDGTAAIKFRDIQNDLIMIDIDALKIPDTYSDNGLEYILLANRYESHRQWVRYTSDTAESTYGDIKGDIPPDLMRVVGAFPEKLAVIGDQLFVTMQGSNQVQQLKINPTAADPSDYLIPVSTYTTGMQPIGITAGIPESPSEGKLFMSNFLGGSISVIDIQSSQSHEVVIDPSIENFPVPATNAERGEIFAHTALFSSDGDTSCFHCHYQDMGDGRPWGVSQVMGQEFISSGSNVGQFIIGGTMSVPQMRNLFSTQPFFYEGVISAFEPRSMIMEHSPADDFTKPTPQGDFTGLDAHYLIPGVDDIQSGMENSTNCLANLEERRDEMFRRFSMKYFGKAFNLLDFQRFVGEWQIHEPRLLPNPFDQNNPSVVRGKLLFEDPQVGCISCHIPPHFTKKDFAGNKQQSITPVVTLTVRDGAFTLIGMNRLDYINDVRRDLEPWDMGRAEESQGHFTVFPLRGIWDRPPAFLHNGMARTLREVIATPGHLALQTFKYEPRIGGNPERPNRGEIGFNMTCIFENPQPQVKLHMQAKARIGFDTHGGTSQLTAQQIDDLVNFMNSIE